MDATRFKIIMASVLMSLLIAAQAAQAGSAFVQ